MLPCYATLYVGRCCCCRCLMIVLPIIAILRRRCCYAVAVYVTLLTLRDITRCRHYDAPVVAAIFFAIYRRRVETCALRERGAPLTTLLRAYAAQHAAHYAVTARGAREARHSSASPPSRHACRPMPLSPLPFICSYFCLPRVALVDITRHYLLMPATIY